MLTSYRGYCIRPHHGAGPAWYWQHKDFDGPGDDRYGYANSEAEARELIDEQLAEEVEL